MSQSVIQVRARAAPFDGSGSVVTSAVAIRGPVEQIGQLPALEGRERCPSAQLLFDAAGRRRSPATMPGHNAGRAPRNKGMVYPADPPTFDEIVAVMRQTPTDRHGLRLRALVVVPWHFGFRIQEALSLIESDLDVRRGRFSCAEGRETSAGRSEWTPGGGAITSLCGSPAVRSCRSARCSA